MYVCENDDMSKRFWIDLKQFSDNDWNVENGFYRFKNIYNTSKNYIKF